MANTKSAAKRVLVIKKKTLRNNMKKSALRTSIKKCRKPLQQTASRHRIFERHYKAIDKAASKNILHKNTAAKEITAVRAFNAAAGK